MEKKSLYQCSRVEFGTGAVKSGPGASAKKTRKTGPLGCIVKLLSGSAPVAHFDLGRFCTRLSRQTCFHSHSEGFSWRPLSSRRFFKSSRKACVALWEPQMVPSSRCEAATSTGQFVGLRPGLLHEPQILHRTPGHACEHRIFQDRYACNIDTSMFS